MMRFMHLATPLVLGLFILSFSACSTSKQTANSDSYASSTKIRKKAPQKETGKVVEVNKDKPSNLSLADMLQRIPGVNVTGSGMNVSVQVRGVNSFNLNTQPLYVIDGVPVGSNYASIATTLDPNQIKRISLLTGSDATIYGVRGSNGVILITQKK